MLIATLIAGGFANIYHRLDVLNAVLRVRHQFNILLLLFGIYESLQAKTILEDHFKSERGLDVKFSNIWLVLFTILYLQYKINTLVNRELTRRSPENADVLQIKPEADRFSPDDESA